MCSNKSFGSRPSGVTTSQTEPAGGLLGLGSITAGGDGGVSTGGGSVSTFGAALREQPINSKAPSTEISDPKVHIRESIRNCTRMIIFPDTTAQHPDAALSLTPSHHLTCFYC
jgi:hypothetical protein